MIRDWRGEPIQVGSAVLYPGRRGSSLWVTVGIVIGIGVGDKDGRLRIRVKKTREAGRPTPYETTVGVESVTVMLAPSTLVVRHTVAADPDAANGDPLAAASA